jgi:predicted Zn-dependent protease
MLGSWEVPAMGARGRPLIRWCLVLAIQHDLQEMDAALPVGPSAATAAVLRAGFLARHGLLHDARLCVSDAVARRPDEPTLHFLLGELSARQGLTQEAMEAFAEARFLLGTPGTPR